MTALSEGLSGGAGLERRLTEPERWRVHTAGAEQGRVGAAAWEEVLARTHVSFDVRLPRSGSGFSGSVQRRRLGPLSLVDCVCMPFAGRRGRAVMGDAGQDRVGLQMVLRGAERVVRSDNDQQVLTRGAVGLWDGSCPVGVEVVEPFHKRTLILPRSLAHAVSPRLAEVEGLSGLGGRASARLLVRYLDALVDELPELEERAAQTAADVVLELLRAVLEPDLPGLADAHREALRARARRYLRAHLADPGLSPESIARALAVSVRTLHAAFEDSGESVAALVRRTRLARCREDLSDPASGSVTEIAFRWGFSNATHFSHVFKREYGMSPRQARQASAG